MTKRIIEISVNDEYVVGSGVVIGAAGSHNDVVLRVTFNKEWRTLNIIATFHDARGENPVAVSVRMSTVSTLVEEGNDYEIHEFSIPHEVKKYEGKITLAFTGYTVVNVAGEGKAPIYQEAAVINTGTAYFNVLASNVKMADELFKNADVGQQLHDDVNTLGGMYGDLRTAAEALKTIGEGIGDMEVDPAQNMLDHITRKDNPHEVNYSQVGAAPAGYGLGESVSDMKHLDDVHKIKMSGWYRCSSNTQNWVKMNGAICANVSESNYITLIGYVQGLYSFNHMAIIRKVKYAGNWGEWEHVNPPMSVGVEYRTTERWKGEAVYIKAINFGQLPSNTSKVMAFGIGLTSIENVVDFGGMAYSEESAIDLKACRDIDIFYVYISNNFRVIVNCTTDMSAFSAIVWVKYTKNED